MPLRKICKKTSQYQKLSNKLLTLENTLSENSNKTNQEIFEKMFEIRGEQESILEKDSFILGFRLGGQLVFEILSPYESQFE